MKQKTILNPCVCMHRVSGVVRIVGKHVAKWSYTVVWASGLEYLNSVLAFPPEFLETVIACVTQ